MKLGVDFMKFAKTNGASVIPNSLFPSFALKCLAQTYPLLTALDAENQHWKARQIGILHRQSEICKLPRVVVSRSGDR
jgi:hypothetical protein